MSKPGRRINTPSEGISRFTDREDQQAVFHRLLSAAEGPPVLVFYGVGGAGKTSLLTRLRAQVPDGIPLAYLDFDVAANGQRFAADPGLALHSIQQQLAKDTPRFNLALAMLRHKQGISEEPGLCIDIAADVASSFVPGGGVVLRCLSKRILARLEGTPLEKLLGNVLGTQLVLELREKNDQEIGNNLLYYLKDDLREALPLHLNRAVSCVIFLDTFEALGAGLQNEEHKREHEMWVQNMAAEFDFALVVVASQNRLNWDEADPDWANNLDQHLVGGLAESDVRQLFVRCGIEASALQASILATAQESSGGYHCLSLGLCADIVFAERSSGREPSANTLRFSPGDWEKLARRFLKSLSSNGERRWIEKLALTPRFDEAAARQAFCSGKSSDQDVAWESLHNYSFIERLSDASGWSGVRSQLRSALGHRLSAQARIEQDHEWWKSYWAGRSQSEVDDAAALSWYHHYRLAPSDALNSWKELAQAARTAVPPRMQEHFRLLFWMESLGLSEGEPVSEDIARALYYLGNELLWASLGRRSSNLQKTIACYEAALRVHTAQEFPQDWAGTQNNLGIAWTNMPTGNPTANLEKAIACYEAALRVHTEQEFPRDWANIQNNLGIAWKRMPTGERGANLERAIACYEAALRVRTEQEFPREWAGTQCNLGIAWSEMPTGDRGANFERAISCCELALRVYTEQEFPADWAKAQNNLGSAWSEMPSGDQTANLERAIACYGAALRVRTEQEFPREWAGTQRNLGVAWSEMPTGDRTASLGKAIACYEAALRVHTEQEFPRDWATTQNDLGIAWKNMQAGDRGANLEKAIACYEGALRIRTEHEFPQDWAGTQINLGNAWSQMPTGEQAVNIEKAITHFEAALRVYTEQGFPRMHEIATENLRSVRADSSPEAQRKTVVSDNI
jgi:tetratricopeptide (TPR) repeat protein